MANEFNFGFGSLEFKQLWLVARNRYFQYYALGEVGILVEVGGLSIQYLDGGKRGMLGKNEP